MNAATRSPLKPLSSAAFVFLLCASSARAFDLTANHPGFSVEWIHHTDGPATDLAVGDADGDGDLDMFVVDGNSLRLWVNDGLGRFDVRPGSICTFPVGSVLALDVDGDTRVDVVVAARTGAGGLAVLKGLGAGRFAVPEISAAGQTYGLLRDFGIDERGRGRILAAGIAPRLGFDVLEIDRGGLRIAESYLSEALISGLAVADLNGDGISDVVASGNHGGEQGEGTTVMLPGILDGLGSPVSIPRRWAASRIAPVDLDGDGDLDLVMGGEVRPFVFRNDGTGRHWIPDRDLPDRGQPGVLAADMDRDGRPELLVSRRESWQGVFIDEYQCGDDHGLEHPREFSYMHVPDRGQAPGDMTAADLNGDGWLDLIVRSEQGEGGGYQRTPGMIGVLLARPGGELGGMRIRPLGIKVRSLASAHLQIGERQSFLLTADTGLFLTSLREDDLTPPVRIGDGDFVKAVDLNGDGRDDLILGNAGTTEIRLTSRDGRPGDVSARFDGRVVDVGDLDHDRYPDLVVQRSGNELDVIWGHPGLRFQRVSRLPWAPRFAYPHDFARIADVDGDGKAELVELRLHPWDGYRPSTPDTVTVYRIAANGKARLLAMTAFPTLAHVDGAISDVQVADLDDIPGKELVLVNEPSGTNQSCLIVLRAVAGSYCLGETTALDGESPAGLSLGDFDGDGDVDAACTTSFEAFQGMVQIRWNDGHGHLGGDWARRVAESAGLGTTAGDFDGDGVLDLAVLAYGYLAPYDSRVTFLFGRRDPVSSVVSALDNDQARGAPNALDLGIRDIAPNPARGQFAIRWSSHANESATIDLHDVAGRRVRSAQISGSQPGERETRFESLGDLPAGIYWIRIRQGNAVATKRVALIR